MPSGMSNDLNVGCGTVSHHVSRMINGDFLSFTGTEAFNVQYSKILLPQFIAVTKKALSDIQYYRLWPHPEPHPAAKSINSPGSDKLFGPLPE